MTEVIVEQWVKETGEIASDQMLPCTRRIMAQRIQKALIASAENDTVWCCKKVR